MKIVLAVLLGLFAVASESLVSVLLAALAGWLLGGQLELSQRLRKLEARLAAGGSREAKPAPSAAAREQQEPERPRSGDETAAGPSALAAKPAAATLPGDELQSAPDSGAAEREARAAERHEGPPGAGVQFRSAPPPLPGSAHRPQSAGETTQAQPRSARAPTDEGSGGHLAGRLLGWLFGGNLPVKLGVLVLFAGVAAALRYAAQQGLFELPIGWRFIGIGAAAVGGLLFALGQRSARPAFSLSLQGGAIGVLLLCVFAAFRLYGLLAPATALAFVISLVSLAALLAVWQNAAALAVLGFLGGYLGPVLINSGSGDQIALFTYYAALNAALFGVAWWRHWHALNLLGFLFTFAVGSLWGLRSYTTEDYASSQFFLLLFWAFYLGIAVLGAVRRGLPASRHVQASLTFALPLWGFSLQAGLLEGDGDMLSISAAVAAAVYAAISALLIRRAGSLLQGVAFAWVAAGFVTVAIPLAFSAQQTAAIWALQGVGAIWLGLRQQQPLNRAFGWLLQLAAAGALLMHVGEALNDGRFESAEYSAGLRFSLFLLASAGFIASRLSERVERASHEVWLGFLVGAGWSGLLWLHLGWLPPFGLDHFESLLGIAVLIAWVASLLRSALDWSRLGWLSVPTLMALPLLGLCALVEQEAPALDGRGFALWTLVALASGLTLRALRVPPMRLTGGAHLAVLATLTLALGSDFALRGERADLGSAWIWTLAVLPLAALSWALWRQPGRFAWPLADRFARYARVWHGGAVLSLGAAWLASLYSTADAAPLPYLPLLNPLELLQWGLLLLAWQALAPGSRTDLLPLRAGLTAAALLLLTLAALRSLHHHAQLPWSPALFDSALTQGVLSVLWALAGVIAWVTGSRRGNWHLWLGGAALMGVVLLKLVLVDRAYLGNLAGIAAVLTVGLLLVVVGYLAPSPPRRAQRPH